MEKKTVANRPSAGPSQRPVTPIPRKGELSEQNPYANAAFIYRCSEADITIAFLRVPLFRTIAEIEALVGRDRTLEASVSAAVTLPYSAAKSMAEKILEMTKDMK